MAYRVEFSGVTVSCDTVGEAAVLARELAQPQPPKTWGSLMVVEPRKPVPVPPSTPPAAPRPAPSVTSAGRGFTCRDCKGHFTSKGKTGPVPTFCTSCAGKQKGKARAAKCFDENQPIGGQK